MSSSTGYGPKLDPIALQKVLDHVMARNAQIAEAGGSGSQSHDVVRQDDKGDRCLVENGTALKAFGAPSELRC